MKSKSTELKAHSCIIYFQLELELSTPPCSELLELENSAGLCLENGLQVGTVDFGQNVGYKVTFPKRILERKEVQTFLDDAKSARNARSSVPRAGAGEWGSMGPAVA